MAGENVVASGAIAVNLTLNDPQGAFTGGATPGAPGAGAVPSGARRGEYVGFLSPEQREGLKGARKEQEYLKELADYNKLVLKELPEDKATKGIMKKFLPMLGGVLGIATIAQHSMILSQSMGALFKILGAFADLLLMPFFPLIAAALTTLSEILSGVAEVMKDPKEFVKAVWGRIEGYGKTALDAIGKYADPVWEWIKEKFEKYFPWLKGKGEKKDEKTGELERPGALYKYFPNFMKKADEEAASFGKAIGDFFRPIEDFFNSPGFKAFLIGAAGGGAVGGAMGAAVGGPALPVTAPIGGILGVIAGGLAALATQQELAYRKTVTNNITVTVEGGLSSEEQARRIQKLLHDTSDERYP